MCPRWDRLRRANNKSAISTYEVDENGYFGETRAVKSFHRPAAGDVEDLPEDLRTEETLIMTLDYLVHDIIGKWSFTACQNFVWDRTRSIRQDCSIQGLNSDAVIGSYERIARFHIFSIQQLSHNESFQRGQEFEQLSKTLISLNELYDDRRRLIKQGLREYSLSNDFEAEFRAYTLVSNLYSPLQLARAMKLPSRITESPIFRIALMLFKYAQRANHDDKNLFGNTSRSEATLNWSAQFFDVIHDISTPYLLACLAAAEFTNVKKGAIKTFERGFPPQKKASNLTVLKELVDASSEQDVKWAVERYGLKTTEHNGVLYMDCPRKSQPSTWIANPSPLPPPFPLLVEGKRGQDTSGQFVPARFFIDEPGCYRRVVSQLSDEEVDIKYHDPVRHEPTPGGPAHIVKFASSWESVGSFIYDVEGAADEDSATTGLFDLIQNTKDGIVPATQAENLITYLAQRKKPAKKIFTQARSTTFVPRPQQKPRQQTPASNGYAAVGTTSGAIPVSQPQFQSRPQVPNVPPTFSSAFPSQQAIQLPPTEGSAVPKPTVASAFSSKSTVASAFGVPASAPVSAFGAPVSAFGARPAAALSVPAFGARVGANKSVAPAFGTRVSTPPLPAFGQKPAEPTSALVSAFGTKPVGSEPASAFGAASPAPGGTPPAASAFPSATSAFPTSVFGSPKPADISNGSNKPGPIASVFNQNPPIPASVFDRTPSTGSTFDAPAVSVTSTLDPAKHPETSQPVSTPNLLVNTSQKPGPDFTLNPAIPAFISNQNTEPKPAALVFDLKPAPAPPQTSNRSIFDLEPAREKLTSFFPTSVPATKPLVPLSSSVTPQPPQQPVSVFAPPTTPAPLIPLSDPNSIVNESPFTLEEATPQIPNIEIKSPKRPESAKESESEQLRPRLAPSGLPLEEELQDSHNTPLPERLTYQDVIQPIDAEFFRKPNKSQLSSEPWYPGVESLNKMKDLDIWALGEYRQKLKRVAWHRLSLDECKPDGLPKLLGNPEPYTWQLQLICADEELRSLQWFMNKFEGLTKRKGKITYIDVHVASSHMRGQEGCIGGIIFGCTATQTRSPKEVKKALKHDRGVLKRSVGNALRSAPQGKLEVLVFAYHALGRTRNDQLENIKSGLGVPSLEEGGNVSVRVFILEELKDLEAMHTVVKKFGVKTAAEIDAEMTPIPAQESPKKRELDELEILTASLELGTESKRRRYADDHFRPTPYLYGLPAFETPKKKPQQKPQLQQQPVSVKRKAEDSAEKKKKELKRAEQKVSNHISSVSAKFDAWELQDGDQEFMDLMKDMMARENMSF
ncbi:hypothetical protein ABW19_dt0202206 [Dactylella cylindrospora]|nr:hypothetical protein ABW19_dt0202206 [Dactylella cylindrospora]